MAGAHHGASYHYLLPGAQVAPPGLGHIAHEEDAQGYAKMVHAPLSRAGSGSLASTAAPCDGERSVAGSASGGAPGRPEALPVGPASLHLRRLLDSVASSEAWLESLKERNYQLRVRCLQQMRGASILSAMRAAYSMWAQRCAERRRHNALKDMRARFADKLAPVVAMLSGCGARQFARHCLRSWHGVLDDLREERLMIEELEAHRKGRSQVLKQYRELEADLEAERQLTAELQARCQEHGAAAAQLQEDLAEALLRLEGRGREAQELSSRVRWLTGQLEESQDSSSALRRELRSQTERARRLEVQVQQGAEERRELHEALLRSERSAEALRGELARTREQEAGRREALERHRDERVATLESQLLEARRCLEALSRGASAFLTHGGGGGAGCTLAGRGRPASRDSLVR